MQPTSAVSRVRKMVQWTGLAGGPLLAGLAYGLLPHQYVGPDGQLVEFTHAGRATMAVMAWMAAWWLTEAIDISATALLPLVLFPLLQAAGMKQAAAPYAHPLIFLFLGGFLISRSMQRWGLDRRIALVTLRWVGTRPTNMVGGFMAATALLSAFVSNTATTAMMLPIAISVVQLLRDGATERGDAETTPRNFAVCLMLGIAYAASVGGISTIIGTPPNAFLVGFVRDTIARPYRVEVSFVEWLAIGVPLAAIFLPLTWWLLTRWLYPVGSEPLVGARQLIDHELQSLGKPNAGQWATLIVFAGTAACWIARPLLVRWEWTADGATWQPLAGLTDEGIAMTGALLLFLIPADWRARRFVMDWQAARELPWGILILFGGGLSLAAAVEANGVAEFLGSQARYAAGMPSWVIVLAVTTSVIFLTELTSNTATTATLLPVLAALAPGLGVHPFLLVFPATLSASCAFMLPVATPPNAIVFGSGEVTIPQMAKAGLWLNLIGIALVSAIALTWLGPLLGVSF